MPGPAKRERTWCVGAHLTRRLPLEAMCWIVGLVAMAVMDPRADHIVGLCPLDALGLSVCPGCGLGHAVAHLARGEVAASVRAHPLGVPAVLILCLHVGRLLRPAGRADPQRFPSKSTPPVPHVERHRASPRTGGGRTALYRRTHQ